MAQPNFVIPGRGQVSEQQYKQYWTQVFRTDPVMVQIFNRVRSQPGDEESKEKQAAGRAVQLGWRPADQDWTLDYDKDGFRTERASYWTRNQDWLIPLIIGAGTLGVGMIAAPAAFGIGAGTGAGAGAAGAGAAGAAGAAAPSLAAGGVAAGIPAGLGTAASFAPLTGAAATGATAATAAAAGPTLASLYGGATGVPAGLGTPTYMAGMGPTLASLGTTSGVPSGLGTPTHFANPNQSVWGRLGDWAKDYGKSQLGGLGESLSALGEGRAEGRLEEANYGLLYDRNALIRGQLGLDITKYLDDLYGRNVNRAVRGGNLQGTQDFKVTTPSWIPRGQISGGLRPSGITNKNEIGKEMQDRARAQMATPPTIDLPELSTPPKPNALDTGLNWAGAIAPIVSGIVNPNAPVTPTTNATTPRPGATMPGPRMPIPVSGLPDTGATPAYLPQPYRDPWARTHEMNQRNFQNLWLGPTTLGPREQR